MCVVWTGWLVPFRQLGFCWEEDTRLKLLEIPVPCTLTASFKVDSSEGHYTRAEYHHLWQGSWWVWCVREGCKLDFSSILHQVAGLKEEAALGLRSTGACHCDSDQRWWSSILCWGCHWCLDQKYRSCAKKETLQFDRGPKGVKTSSLSFLTKFHLPSARALKVEEFWQCEVTEGGKTITMISLMFIQAIGSLG